MAGKETIRLRTALRMEAEGDEAEILVYGDICSDAWKWSESDVSALDFDKHLKAAKGKNRLVLRINSPGGEVFQAVAMRTMLVNASIPQIEIHIDGLSASAATLLCCVPGAKVRIAEGAEYMIHNPWTFAMGSARDFEHVAQSLRTIEESMRGIYGKRSGQEEAKITAWMDDETWFSAADAVKYGFADELMTGTAVAASVSPDMMQAMRALYKKVPQNIGVQDKEQPKEPVSHETPPVAGGESSEHTLDQEEEHMDIKDLTVEQLRENNAALLSSIQQEGVAAERERVAEIDALTEPGYEEMAAQAKAKGDSPAVFLKAVVEAKKAKAAAFLKDRREETQQAQAIPASAPGEGEGEEAGMKAAAKEIADMAKELHAQREGSMY